METKKGLSKKTEEARQELIDQGNDAEAVDAYIALGTGDDDLARFEEAYQGEWDDDTTFVQNLLQDMREIPKDWPAYIHIDWKSTARDVMMDYAEQNGYYFRNL